jgi:hypothetical protein
MVIELDWLNMLMGRVGNKGYFFHANQVWFVVQGGIVFFDGFFLWRGSAYWARACSLSRLHDHTYLHTQHSAGYRWTSERPVRDNTQHYNIQTSTPLAGFEAVIPTNERPQTYAVTGIGTMDRDANLNNSGGRKDVQYHSTGLRPTSFYCRKQRI